MERLASVPSTFDVGSCFPPRVGRDGSVAGGTGSLLPWFGAKGGGSLRLGCGPSVCALAIATEVAKASAIVPMPANLLNMVSPRCIRFRMTTCFAGNGSVQEAEDPTLG